LVPKTSTTINSTIAQCQMENEPMDLSCLTARILVGQGKFTLLPDHIP
jgi:hypothetical protein